MSDSILYKFFSLESWLVGSHKYAFDDFYQFDFFQSDDTRNRTSTHIQMREPSTGDLFFFILVLS